MIKQVGALALASMFYANLAPAYAGLGKITRSEASAMVSVASVLFVVVEPFNASKNGIQGSSEAASSRRQVAAMRDAGPLPDMRIKTIEPADGGRRIVLENPDDTQQIAVLEWPQHENDPANALTVGELLSFQPTPARSGWIMRSSGGASVGFLPTPAAATDSHSAVM